MDKTPLILASMGGHLGVVRMVAQHMGARGVHETDMIGWTALHYAAREGHEEVVAFLLGMGAHAIAAGFYGHSPFIVAAMKGHLGVVRLLAQQLVGPQRLDVGDDKMLTALHHAAEQGHSEVVAFLLEQGAQANCTDERGRTPLILASFWGHLRVVRVFAQHMDVGPEGLDEGDNLEWTALHHAARQDHEDVVACLVERGAQADSREEEDRTPLILASRWGCMGVVRFLAEHLGSQGLEQEDGMGWRALHHAAVEGQEEVVAFLPSKGAQISPRDWTGETPFIRAAMHGQIGVVRLLLHHLGSPGLIERDNIGVTALHYAAYRGHEEVVSFLLLAGAGPTIKDIDGRTPLAFAKMQEDEPHDDFSKTGKGKCVAVFKWWDGELERRAVLHRATCLHKADTMRRDMPTSQVPTYVMARVAAGHAVPSVEVVSPQSQEGEQGAASAKRKAEGETDDAQGEETEEQGERDAVVEYVIKALNEELVTELLEGFHSD